MITKKFASAAVVALFCLSVSACATMFVDAGLKDVPAADYHKPQAPKPIQLLFSFQTKGASNARATKLLADQVTDLVRSTGLFSAVGSQPVAEGAILSVVINNVPITEDAFAKGFATGLTFGLAGNTVTDGYLCTVDYISASGRPAIEVKTRHAIHTNVGAKKAPDNAVEAKNPEEAVRIMTRQIVGNALKELSSDPGFAP